MKNFFKLLFFLFLLSACSVTQKLSITKKIRIIDRSQFVIDTTEGNTYFNTYSLTTYKEDFIRELNTRLKESNVTIIDTGIQVTDYTLILTKLNFKESIELQEINDTASGDNGRKFPVHVCTMKAETVLYNSKAEVLDNFSVTNYSTEEVTNSRTLFDYIFHTNKENHDYRVKSLANNIFEYVAQGCAKSTTKALVKRLEKM